VVVFSHANIMKKCYAMNDGDGIVTCHSFLMFMECTVVHLTKISSK